MATLEDSLPLIGSGLYSHLLTRPEYSPLWAKWRSTVDEICPQWISKNPFVDVSRGYYHRWSAAGHDPVDVLIQLLNSPVRGVKDAGHVFLTDFVTKQGIPIPFLSKSHLGEPFVTALRTLGLKHPERWLNLNAFDWVLGVRANREAYDDLTKALSNNLEWGWSTFWDTFGQGALYTAFGLKTESPLFLCAAAQEFAAGGLSLYRDLNPIAVPEPTFFEQFVAELPTTQQFAGALSSYLALAAVRSIFQWWDGKASGAEITRQSLFDVFTSTAVFCVSKALLAVLAPVAGGLPIVLPVLIGAGTSFLLRGTLAAAFREAKVENPFCAYPFYAASYPLTRSLEPVTSSAYPVSRAGYPFVPSTFPVRSGGYPFRPEE